MNIRELSSSTRSRAPSRPRPRDPLTSQNEKQAAEPRTAVLHDYSQHESHTARPQRRSSSASSSPKAGAGRRRSPKLELAGWLRAQRSIPGGSAGGSQRRCGALSSPAGSPRAWVQRSIPGGSPAPIPGVEPPLGRCGRRGALSGGVVSGMRSKAAPMAVVVVALVGSACGGGGNGGGSIVAVPAEAPAGRCAEHVSQGVYEWERCAWETYRESAEHNRALSAADADALIALVWRQVEVEGKPADPPTSALVPRNTGCTVGLTVGCYDREAHHIDRSDPFTRTLLHEVAHALTRDHPETEECRQAAGGSHIDRGPPEGHTAWLAFAHNARCSHGDVFRCVADRLFTEYAGIPPRASAAPSRPARPTRPPPPNRPAR